MFQKQEVHNTNQLDEVLRQTQKQLDSINTYISGSRKGILKVQTRNGKDYFYRQYQDINSKQKQEYIRKSDIEKISKLAQKEYYLKLKPILENQIKSIQSTISIYDEQNISSIFDELPQKKKAYVKPINSQIENIIKKWNEEEYEPYTEYSDYLVYRTSRGEMVRSKSEAIIADKLYAHREEVLYKYERPLTVYSRERKIVFHPDFTILNKSTGKIYYWEHEGRLMDPRYAHDMVDRTKKYSDNDIVLGINLFYTFETYNCPLDMHLVNSILNVILNQR